MSLYVSKFANQANTFEIQDSVSGYTTNQCAVSNVFVGNTNVTSSNVANITAKALIDVFYPVGTYYETRETSFNPNIAWGGTWELEIAGQVHVSAGDTYDIGTTGGAVSRTYTPITDTLTSGAYKLGETELTTSQVPSHTHGASDPTATGAVNTWSFYSRRYSTSTSTTATITQTVWASTGSSIHQATGSGGRIVATATDSVAGYRDLVKFDNTHTHTSVGTGKPHTHTFTGTQTTFNLMQPYIVVNRWHRIA